MAKVKCRGLMVLSTMASGPSTSPVERALSTTLMAISTMETGRATRLMAKVFTLMLMKLATKENGRMTSNTVKESRHGLKVPDMRAYTT